MQAIDMERYVNGERDDEEEDRDVTADAFAEFLTDAIQGCADDLLGIEGIVQARSFEDLGILTYNSGFVATLVNGQEFQVTVVRSR